MSVSIETKKNILGQFTSFCALCKDKIIHKDKEDCHETCPFGNIAKDIGKQKEDMDYDFTNSEINQVLLGNEYRSTLSQRIGVKNLSLRKDLYKIMDTVILFDDQDVLEYEDCKVKFSDLYYLNISRLAPFIQEFGFKVDMQRYNGHKSIRRQNWIQEEILNKFNIFFSNLNMNAIFFNSMKTIHEDYVGELAYFDKLDFYFENIAQVVKKEEEYSHIHFTHENGWKLVLYINKNWVTTDDALEQFTTLDFKTLSGIFRVTNVDYSQNTIYGTPFTLALPK